MNPLQAMRDAGVLPENREDVDEFNRLVETCRESPEVGAAEVLRARRHCRQAAGAAEELEKLLEGLVEGNAGLFHLESIKELPEGKVRAICRMGSQLQEVGVHPDLDVETLRRLQPWEYVGIHEGVVVHIWNDDPVLLASQMGEVVTFEGFADREQFQVRVARPGHDESVVTLAGSLRIEMLTQGTKLILQRDDPRWAIASLPAEHAESKFEVPLDQVRTTLDDLAGLEELAEAFIQDILLRVVFEDIRDEFDLAPMRGALLYSYQPGMGKTAFSEALAVWLRDFGDEYGFELALYHVKPNQLKSMWWGEDARIVREELWGSIRARQRLPRDKPLVQVAVFDEIDSLNKRADGGQMHGAASHSDALEALLVEMQGMANIAPDGPPVHCLCIGLTNRPNRIDDALKRPGRFGDLVRSMPRITQNMAEGIMAIYAAKQSLPWSADGEARNGVPLVEVRERFLRPAVSRIFPAVVAKYATDSQRTIDVTAGEILAGAHYEDAVNRAKKRAALRRLLGVGVPAVTADDVVDCLLDVAVSVAEQMEADPGMLVQQLQVKVPVVRVTAVPKSELEQHRFLKLHSA